MKNNDDKWLESLRDSLDDFEVAPRSDTWSRINSDIPAQRRLAPMTFIWRAVAAAACLTIIAGAYFLTTRPDNGGTTPAAPSIISKAEPIPSNSNPVAETSLQSASMLASETETINNTNTPTTVNTPTLISIDDEPVCTVAPTDTTVTEKPHATTREFLDAQPSTPTEVGNSRHTTASTIKRTASSHRWHIALAANNEFGQGNQSSAGGFTPLYHTLGQSQLFATDASSFGTTYLKATTNNIDQATETNDIVSFPVSYSASFRYMLTDRWGINAGISYASALSERRSGSETNYYSSKTRMHYVGLPVSVSYTFFSSRHVSFYALAGGEVAKCVKASRKDIVVASGHEQKQASRSDNLDTRPWQGSLNAGAGAQFNITVRYGIFAEPQLVYDLSDDSASPAKRRNDFSFQLSVGIRLSY